MITGSVFNCLLALSGMLFIYSLVDLNNRIYGNIVCAIIATVISGYLAVIANTGVVGYGTDLAMQDLSLQIILIIVTSIMLIYTVYMIIDAWWEYQTAKENDI